jgi:hypothetical protein
VGVRPGIDDGATTTRIPRATIAASGTSDGCPRRQKLLSEDAEGDEKHPADADARPDAKEPELESRAHAATAAPAASALGRRELVDAGVTELLVEIPAEVDLGLADLVAVKRENLGVAKSAPVGLRALVRHDHLVTGLNEPLELEGLDLFGVRPAALEVLRTVDAHVSRAVEREVVGQKLLDHATVAGLVSPVAVAGEFQTITVRHASSPYLVGL